jgi:hypothetical protein
MSVSLGPLPFELWWHFFRLPSGTTMNVRYIDEVKVHSNTEE